MKIIWNNKRNRWIVESISNYEWSCLSNDDIEPHEDNLSTDIVYDENLWVGHLISICHSWNINLDIEWQTDYYILQGV